MSLHGVIGYHVTLPEGHMIANPPYMGVIGYHMTLSEGHMIANQLPQDGAQVFPYIWGDWLSCNPLRVTWKPNTPYKDIIIHTIYGVIDHL